MLLACAIRTWSVDVSGSHLLQIAHVHDVTTHAGAERCTLTSRSTQQLQPVSGTFCTVEWR